MSQFILRPGVDVVKMLKAAGYSTYTIAKAKERTGDYILGQSTLTKLRRGGLPSWGELAKLCDLLHASPVNLIAFQADDGTVTTFDSAPSGPLATLPEPVPTPVPEQAPPPAVDPNAITVQLDPQTLKNMDGAIRCGYSSDRVQYAIRAINTQLQADIATEKEKRRARSVYPPDDYFDE